MENVITSLDRFMYDRLVTIKGLTIDWEGSDSAEIENADEWVQPRIMGGFPEYLHQVAGNRIGQNTHFLYNINIFVKRGASSSTGGSLNKNRLMQIRDMVAEYYHIGAEIPFMDYAGSSAEIDHIIVRNIETDSAISPTDEAMSYYQWNYTPELVVVQKWAK
jgi:hypothetical protein